MTLQRLRPGLQVVADHAVPGTQLLALSATFANDKRTARIVVIENGVIDAWLGVPLDRVVDALQTMVARVRAEGRVPVLTGFSRQALGGTMTAQSMLLRDWYDTAVRSAAADANVTFADWGAVQFGGAGDLMDFVHPAKPYSDRLVEQLAAALDRAVPECAL